MGISDYSNSIYDPGVRSIREALNHKEKDLKQMTATTDPINHNLEDSLDIHDYVRKPFFVRGVQVTEENIELVAKWCKGVLHLASETGKRSYISVDVPRAMNDRQRMAFVGDWVLASGTTHKVFTKNAFDASFELTAKPDAGVEGELVQKSREDLYLEQHGEAQPADGGKPVDWTNAVLSTGAPNRVYKETL